jgi:hypothetical protein
MNADPLTTPHRSSTSSRVFARLLQCFSLATLVAIGSVADATELRLGNAYPLTFTDVDQHQLSTSNGQVTIITVVTRKDEQKAQAVGDRFPRAYLGDPKYRLITLVNFQQKIFPPFRGVVSAIIRHRLDLEAKELQKIYSAKHLNRNPRYDILVVPDFDGKAVSQLGLAPASAEFAVFAFDGRGRLVRRWNDVPSTEALTAAINEAR